MNEGSNDFKKFITAILKKDAEQRPAALDILNLSFI